MIAVVRLALSDLWDQRRIVLGALLLVAAPIAGFLLLDGYTRAVDAEFTDAGSRELVVQAANSVGEFAGSRIPAETEADLIALGAGYAIPEIHTVTGTGTNTATLIRGVDPDRYEDIAPFTIVAGQALGPASGDRDVMIGLDLAEDRGAVVGSTIDIRGRTFTVIGVFSVGTYADNEAWMTISGAQLLLGWDDEVSIFVVPDEETLQEGDVLAGPLSVARRGDFVVIADEWDPVVRLLRFASASLGIAGALILGIVLWRFAWLRSRELAILRALGMGRAAIPTFLVTQGLVLTGLGWAGAAVAAVALGPVIEVQAFGITAAPDFDLTGILRGGMAGFLILVIAVVVNAGRLRHTSLSRTLRRE